MSELKIYVKDQHGTPISGATVRLVDSTNTTTISQQLTDGSGVAYFDPAVGSYVIRLYKNGVFFDGQLGDSNAGVQSIEVVGPSDSYDVVGRIPELEESLDSRLCLVTGSLSDLRLSPYEPTSRVIIFAASPSWESRVFGTTLVVGEEVVVQPDEGGNLQVPLVRNGFYEVTLGDWRTRSYLIHVPDSPSARFEDLLFPYPVSLSATPSTVSLAVEATTDVSISVVMSDGQVIINPLSELDPVYSASGVVSMTASDVGISLTGISAGSVDITWAMKSEVRDPGPVGVSYQTIHVTVA